MEDWVKNKQILKERKKWFRATQLKPAFTTIEKGLSQKPRAINTGKVFEVGPFPSTFSLTISPNETIFF